MRVVAGAAGGIPLLAPRSVARPTMDRVKAAIFSSLADLIPGARVLDLFAGSGAIGIEALSRGAASATFVESDPAAIDVIRRNLAKTRLTGDAVRADAFKFLSRRPEHSPPWQLVFADPPYTKSPGARDIPADLLASDPLRRALAPGGLLILESPSSAPLSPPPPWRVLRAKAYGATAITFLVLGSETSIASLP